MAPPGPPPYTIDQINAMSSKEERVRARAELSSMCGRGGVLWSRGTNRIATGYIARMKKEKQDRLAQDAHPYGGYAPQTRHYDGRHSSGPVRGGYKYSASGSTHQPYHPYQRAHPTYGATKFKNRTVVFNKQDGQTATSESGYSSNDASPRGSKQQTESKTLCPALTSTGIWNKAAHPLHDPLRILLTRVQVYVRATAAATSTIPTNKHYASAGSTKTTAQRETFVNCRTRLHPITRRPVSTSRKGVATTKTVALRTFASTRQPPTAPLLGAWGTVRRATSAPSCMPTSVRILQTRVNAGLVTSASCAMSIARRA
jgi:hypothetical protein